MKTTQKIAAILAAALALFSLTACGGEKTEETVRLDFLAATDLAGAIEANDYYAGLAKFAAYIDYYRQQNPEATFVTDCGDALVGTPVSNLQQGKPVVAIMNQIGYDVMNIGNHEFDWGMDVSGATLQEDGSF